MSASTDEVSRVLAEADCLHDESAVTDAYDALAAAIASEYRDRNPLIMTVMNGGLYVTAELTRRMPFPLEVAYLHATRYRGATSGGELVWQHRPAAERVRDRHVLVVDDILDEGNTLVQVRAELEAMLPASLAVAVLAEKLHDRRAVGAHAEFIGLSVPDRYVFGCGMDYKEYWRQLPAIYAVKGL